MNSGASITRTRKNDAHARNLWELAVTKLDGQKTTKSEQDNFILFQLTLSLARLDEEHGNFASGIQWLERAKTVAPFPADIEKSIEEDPAEIGAECTFRHNRARDQSRSATLIASHIMALLDISKLKKTFRSPDGESHRRSWTLTRSASRTGPQVVLERRKRFGQDDASALDRRHSQAGLRLHRHRRAARMSALKEPDRGRLRATTIGYIFQTFNLLQGYTCLENVLLGMSFGPGVDREFAQALLQRVGLGTRLKHYPRQLSTGQQQRAAVARALANRPKLVLATTNRRAISTTRMPRRRWD